MMRVLIVIPAYNEAQNLERVVDSLIACCPQFDYVIVNDGSADGTKKLCEKKHYHVINLPVNLGLTGAVRTGMKYAYQKKYDMAIQFDADGQHLPQYIAPMVQHMKESRSDILIASRYVGGKMPPPYAHNRSNSDQFGNPCYDRSPDYGSHQRNASV